MFIYATKVVLFVNIYKYHTIVCVSAFFFVLLWHKYYTTMKKLILGCLLLMANAVIQAQEIHYLTTQEFNEKVCDFTKKGWSYLGTKPCIIDFYAPWCGPCRMLEPILKELAKEYKDQIIFYKIDIDKEPSLAKEFRIESIPYTLFVPLTGNPTYLLGYHEKDFIKQGIHEVLLK